jgi:hypothetical protein
MIRGPYCTGAVTPSGACAFVSHPHPHSSVSSWCSVVLARTGGMPITWRRSTAVTAARFRDFPQQPHRAGRCRTVLSGFSLSCIVAPGCPFGRPGLRPDFPRSDFGLGFASPSDDGGLDEFRELDCTRAAKSATCDCSAARCPRSAAISASCSAIRVPFLQQLPQPRIRSTKPGSIISPARRLGHAPHRTTTSRHLQIDGHQTASSQQQRLRNKGAAPTRQAGLGCQVMRWRARRPGGGLG